ncbi:MAG: M20/M25/M40 family metallo-hydrolase [Phycisphaerae bacterium]|nr:M20/M25/M40 family metallo-hydrolase [Phycisphaerae bacterium]
MTVLENNPIAWKRRFNILVACLAVPLISACKPESAPKSAPRSTEGGPIASTNEPTPIADQYSDVANRIIEATLARNDAYEKMRQICDGIGHRLSGSPQLARAIEWAADSMKADGQENVRTEPVMVPKWVRGREAAVMIAPREYDLHMLGLGMSVGTPPEGLTASVVSVRDEEEFEALGESVRGKIVLFNNLMPEYDPERGAGYGTAVRFRSRGPSMASRRGAVACFVRSVTARSLRSPHTGATRYEEGTTPIPAAAISTEDADMISRLTAAGEDVRVLLKMEARDEGMSPSANVVGELRGRELPDEVLVIGGHIDSWDTGHGAHDDAGGCVVAMEAINVLRKLNLRPRRTIRVVLWTNEENGLAGGRQYAIDHANELPNHVGAIEMDSGVFTPHGLGVDCSDESRRAKAAAQLRDILSLLARFGPMRATEGGGGADIGPMKPAGVLLMGFDVAGDRYFDYHHSHADTLDKVDPRDLSECVAAMATISYIIADMPQRLGE